MTDKEKLCQLLESWGIKWEEYKDKDNLTRITVNQQSPDGEYQEKVKGYLDFYTSYAFTETGDFAFMGAWE